MINSLKFLQHTNTNTISYRVNYLAITIALKNSIKQKFKSLHFLSGRV